jgi:hypothetical protein
LRMPTQPTVPPTLQSRLRASASPPRRLGPHPRSGPIHATAPASHPPPTHTRHRRSRAHPTHATQAPHAQGPPLFHRPLPPHAVSCPPPATRQPPSPCRSPAPSRHPRPPRNTSGFLFHHNELFLSRPHIRLRPQRQPSVASPHLVPVLLPLQLPPYRGSSLLAYPTAPMQRWPAQIRHLQCPVPPLRGTRGLPGRVGKSPFLARHPLPPSSLHGHRRAGNPMGWGR